MEDYFKLFTIKPKKRATSGVNVIDVATCTTTINAKVCAILNIIM
jgi:hypothetical protein